MNALQSVPGIEVIIIGRGGGSAEDLACFNDEELARAKKRVAEGQKASTYYRDWIVTKGAKSL